MRNTLFKRSAALLLASVFTFMDANTLWGIRHLRTTVTCANAGHYRSWWHERRAYFCTASIEQSYHMAYCRHMVAYKNCKKRAWDECMDGAISSSIRDAGVAGLGAAVATGGALPITIGVTAVSGVGSYSLQASICRLDSAYRAARAQCKAIRDRDVQSSKALYERRKREKLEEAIDRPHQVRLWTWTEDEDGGRPYETWRMIDVPQNGHCDECEARMDEYMDAINGR